MASLFARVLGLMPESLMMEPDQDPEPPKIEEPEDPEEWIEMIPFSGPATLSLFYKLDGVGPVDNRPSTD